MTNAARGQSGADHTMQIVTIGAVLYVVAWFVPVARFHEVAAAVGSWLGGTSTGGGLPPGVRGPDWLPGLQAFDVAWQLLTGQGSGDGAWKHRLAGATCLTNVAMIAAFVAILAKWPRAPFGVVLLVCAAWNACWLYLDGMPPADTFGVGYWLWLASFVLVGIGLATSRKKP